MWGLCHSCGISRELALGSLSKFLVLWHRDCASPSLRGKRKDGARAVVGYLRLGHSPIAEALEASFWVPIAHWSLLSSLEPGSLYRSPPHST